MRPLAEYLRQFVPPFQYYGVSAKLANLFLADDQYLKESLAWHDVMRPRWEHVLSRLGSRLNRKSQFPITLSATNRMSFVLSHVVWGPYIQTSDRIRVTSVTKKH